MWLAVKVHTYSDITRVREGQRFTSSKSAKLHSKTLSKQKLTVEVKEDAPICPLLKKVLELTSEEIIHLHYLLSFDHTPQIIQSRGTVD